MMMSALYVFFWRFLYPIVYKSALFFIGFLPSSHRLSIWKRSRRDHLSMPKSGESVLFFCPSLGEYQAIKPLIHLHKDHRPQLQIEVAFFSSSGYTSLTQMDHLADQISYTPLDTYAACRAFFSVRHTRHVIISTLALWPGFLGYLYHHQIPFTFVNARIRTGGLRELYYRSFKKFYSSARAIYASDSESVRYLRSCAPSATVESGGDARIKMILDHYKNMEMNFHHRAGIILASIEPSEEDAILDGLGPLLSLDVPITIAPHDIERAPSLNQKINHLYKAKSEQINVISEMGLLLDLYPQHSIAYVGGGFDKGIHNIAEPLIAGCRVIVGSKYDRDIYAQKCVAKNIVSVVSHPSKINPSISALYLKSKDLPVYDHDISWIIAQGDRVDDIFDEMKSVY